MSAQLARQIALAPQGHETDLPARSNEAHRFPRRAEAGLFFGTDGHPLDEAAKRVDENASRLCPAVDPSRRAGGIGSACTRSAT